MSNTTPVHTPNFANARTIQNGSPLILKDAGDMKKKHGFEDGMKGFANAVIDLGSEGTFVFFMPDGIRKSYVLNINRFEFDQERAEELGL